jgi:hypothetical protein
LFSSLFAGSLARIEGVLDELVRDIKARKKEPSVTPSATYEEEEGGLALGELERELVRDEVTRQDVEKYEEDIKEYLLKLIQENIMGMGASSCISLVSTYRTHLSNSDLSSNVLFLLSDC